MEKTTNILTYILITLILIFIVQIFLLGDCLKANFCLKKDGCWLEGEKPEVKVIEKTVIGYKYCPEYPLCPEDSFDCPAI